MVQCPICRARLESALPFCPVCGAQLDDSHAREEEELRSVLYLLSELSRWESSGQIAAEQAAHLRAIYEHRRDDLRRGLAARLDEKLKQTAQTGETERPPVAQTEATRAEQTHTQQTAQQREEHAPRESEFVAFPARPPAAIPPRLQSPPVIQRPQLTLLERLADPRTLRLLLYTGAAMLVVSIVIWLRDLLYLKLQGPVVQAGLLAFGTIVFIASGWYIILRTRQRWTGRALTLAGSLLVPVNFWFLVRSGLIENHGRAWVVCVFCALLYAYTAAILRERLYVYLSCLATAATLWALILRDAPRAFGLYALSLMTASLVFLHLSQLFSTEKVAADEPEEDKESEDARSRAKPGRWSHELWSVPLARIALVFASLSAIFYMPLRFMPDAASFYDGIFRLRSSAYDASIALVLLAAAAYALWFAGRYVYLRWSAVFYTMSALLFFSALWAACDGLRLSPPSEVLTLSLMTFLVALVARSLRSPASSQPLHHAGLVVSIILAIACVSVLMSVATFTATESASFALVAASFAVLSAPRFGSRAEQTALAHFAALYFSASYFVALASASLKSETLVTLLCAAWPVLLFCAAELFIKLKRETQLSAPFVRVANALILLLLLWGSVLALSLQWTSRASLSSTVAALGGVVLYGALGNFRSRSIYGAALATLASIIMMAAVLDALQRNGVWPARWPVAAGTIVFAFLLERACVRLLRTETEAQRSETQPLIKTIRIVLDVAVAVCTLLWLIIAFTRLGTGGFDAPSVLLLALLYRVERAAVMRNAWHVRVACAHLGAFLITLLIALRVDSQWLVFLFTLTLFPTFFILSRRARSYEWLRAPLSEAATVSLMVSLLAALIQASPNLQAGDEHLLAPSLTVAAVSLLSFAASIFSRGRASVLYFRAGLWTAVVAIMLASLRAGFSPLGDAEVYSTPVAVLILLIAYLSHRRAWEDYDRDVGALLWVGSVLLCAPLLFRAMQFRLLLDSAAPWRDVAVLIASLALILYSVVGRMRAPVITGSVTLITELAVLTLTTVDWLQVPLKYYLMTVGALLLIIFGTLEYRREQFLLMRKRFQERRDSVREQFGEWR